MAQARRASLPPFEFALMFSIKSKRHSDSGRCARNPNRGHKLPKGNALELQPNVSRPAITRPSPAKLPVCSQPRKQILSFDPEDDQAFSFDNVNAGFDAIITGEVLEMLIANVFSA